MSMNPIEWLAWIYGRLFQSHPVLGGVLVTALFAAGGLVLWFRAIDTYKEAHALPKPQAVAISKPEKPATAERSTQDHHGPVTELGPTTTKVKGTVNRAAAQHATAEKRTHFAELSDSQRLVLIQKLQPYAGNTIRLVQVGSEPQSNVAFSQLDSIFAQSGWKRQTVQQGIVSIQGSNFPAVTYLSGPNMSSKLLSAVYSIFASVGIDLPMTPDAYVGPLSLGEVPEVVIVIRNL